MNQTTINRYSEADLVEFKAAIEKKLQKANNQLAYLEEQLVETAETKGSQGDWMDDSTSSNDLDMLQTMAHRQKKHITDLNNALQRIHNKSYGICSITGELIDKRRLLAVPTTTKSLAAKMANALPEKPQVTKVANRATTGTKKVFSRIISKPTAAPTSKTKEWDEEDDLDMELEKDLITADEMDNEIDFDSLSDEDLKQ